MTQSFSFYKIGRLAQSQPDLIIVKRHNVVVMALIRIVDQLDFPETLNPQALTQLTYTPTVVQGRGGGVKSFFSFSFLFKNGLTTCYL